MPNSDLSDSPLALQRGKVSLFYRDIGSGTPLLVLHGGWGYGAYPFDNQIEALGDRFQFLIPDRSGYGKSGRIGEFPIDFHRRAGGEMIRFLDSLNIDRCLLWGHSDGAVIALWMAIEHPQRCAALVIEATHYYRNKPASRSFFESAAANPEGLGARVTGVLSEEHGSDYWRDLIHNASDAWLRLADQAPAPDADLYDGRLSAVKAPVLILHGARDPRTEPDEIQRLHQSLPHAGLHIIESAGHSPHSEKASAAVCNRIARAFLNLK